MDTSIDIAIKFVNANQKEEILSNGSSLSGGVACGDMIICIAAILAILAVVTIGFLCKNRKTFKPIGTSDSHLNNTKATDTNLFLTKIKKSDNLMVVCAVVLFTLAIFLGSFSILHHAFAQQISNFKGSDIIGYVDEETGQISFSDGAITNIGDSDAVVSQVNVQKPSGVDDGNCVWTLNSGDINLFSGATSVDGSVTTLTQELNIKANGGFAPLSVAVDGLDIDKAISLIGKDVVSLSFPLQDKEDVVHVAGVELEHDALSLQIGESLILKAIVKPENATDKTLYWSSSDEGVALVDNNGLITAKNAGQATIKVFTNDGGFSDCCTVNVLSPTPVIEIPIPVKIDNLTYNGESQAGVVYLDEYSEYFTINGDVSASDAGEYVATFSLKDKNATKWDDDTTENKIFNWSISKAKIIKPTSVEGLVYTGDLLTGVETHGSEDMYDLSSHQEQDSGSYTAKAMIKGDATQNYMWEGEESSLQTVYINWTIAQAQNDMTFYIKTSSYTSDYSNDKVSIDFPGLASQVPENLQYGLGLVKNADLDSGVYNKNLLDNIDYDSGNNFKVEYVSTSNKWFLYCSPGTEPGTYSLKLWAKSGGDNYEEKYVPSKESFETNFTWTINKLDPQFDPDQSMPKPESTHEMIIDKDSLVTSASTNSDGDVIAYSDQSDIANVTYTISEASSASRTIIYHINPLSEGTTKIILGVGKSSIYNSATREFYVKVDPFIHVEKIELDQSSLNLEVDQSVKLTYTITPSNATDKSVSWTSSNTDVATVDNNGVVVACKEGNTNITVKTIDGSHEDSCKVQVKPLYKTTIKSDGHTNIGIDASMDQSDVVVDKVASVYTLEAYPTTLCLENANRTIQVFAAPQENYVFDGFYIQNGEEETKISTEKTTLLADSIVVAKSKDTVKTPVKVPTKKLGLVYNGSEQCGFSNLDYSLYQSTNENGTDAGQYVAAFSLKDHDKYEWADGTGSSDKEIKWSISKLRVDAPSAKSGLVYNGKIQTGVLKPDTANYYNLTNNQGVDASSYNAEATLVDPNNYCWTNTYDEIAYIPWSISKRELSDCKIDVKYKQYDGSSQNVEYALSHDDQSVPQEDLYADGVVSAIDAGTYSFSVAAIDDSKNYKGKIYPKWTIDQALNPMSFYIPEGKESVAFPLSDQGDTAIEFPGVASDVREGRVKFGVDLISCDGSPCNNYENENSSPLDSTDIFFTDYDYEKNKWSLVCRTSLTVKPGIYHLKLWAKSGGNNYAESYIPAQSSIESNFTWTISDHKKIRRTVGDTELSFFPVYNGSTPPCNFYVYSGDGSCKKLDGITDMTSLATAIKNIDPSKNPKDNTINLYTDAKDLTFFATLDIEWNKAFNYRGIGYATLSESFKNKYKIGVNGLDTVYKNYTSGDNPNNWDSHDDSEPRLEGNKNNKVGYLQFYNSYVNVLNSFCQYQAWGSRVEQIEEANFWYKEGYWTRTDYEYPSCVVVLSQDF